jgi:hypothetical protein
LFAGFVSGQLTGDFARRSWVNPLIALDYRSSQASNCFNSLAPDPFNRAHKISNKTAQTLVDLAVQRRLISGAGQWRISQIAFDRQGATPMPGLDDRHRNKDGEISHKHGNTLLRTLRKIYGRGFAAGYPETEKLSEVLLQLNETSLSQLRRDHETGHLEHKIANASK